MSEGGTGSGDRFAGPYRLIEPLGRGGFGEVFLAQAPDGSRAAVKLLHATWAGDGDMRRRFADEVAQARRVSGFCVAEIQDADPEADQPWIATEYVDGPTLEADVRDRGPRRGADLHRLAVATATALAAVHGAGVVHRDLKPGNIMLAGDGPRVIDFGIARAIEATSMTASGIVGTIGYMAPEQLEGARLTPAVDVFAWGAVMIYAATGREAFAAPTQAARTTRVLTGEPDTGDLAGPLLPVVLACLDKDAANRPGSRTLLDMLLGSHAPDAAGDTGAGTDAATRAERDTLTRVERARDGATRVETATDGAAAGDQGRAGTLLYTNLAPGTPGSPGEAPGPPGGSAPVAETPAGNVRNTASPTPTPTPAPGDPPPAGPGPADLGRGGGSGVPPYWFAGHRCTDPGSLAAAMQTDWTAAVGVFSDEEERAALGAWLVDDIGDTVTDRSIFRRRSGDANRTVAWFIVQQRPDLPPVFRGRPAAFADLRERFARIRPAFTGAPPDNELLMLARPEVLHLLALHDDPGRADLQRTADDLAAAEQAAGVFRRRLEEAVPRLAQHAAVDSALILALLFDPDRPVRPDAGGHPQVQEWYEALWGAVEREQGPARAGTAATVASLTGAARDSGLSSAQWNAELVQAEREREAAAASWVREARLYRIRRLLRFSPWMVVLGGVVALVLEQSGETDAALAWCVAGALAWLAAWIAQGVVGRFSGPRNGHPTAVQAAQARFHQLRDHAARLGQGAERMRAELRAVRAACGG
ncbi:hypothetical protein GCM10027570_30600 [Streptomonospora sediminis]